MSRRAKPTKAKATKARATVAVGRTSTKGEASRRRDLEQRLAEALEQQAATSEILRVIRSSPTDVQPAFDAVAESAARLCGVPDVTIFRRDEGGLRLVAHHGSIPVQSTLPLVRGTSNGRAVLDGRAVHVEDMQTETDEFPEGSENARRMGHRAILCVPLMREGVAMGTIHLRRTEALLFTVRQVALLETFADQAVIAIENVRLFKELETRTRELTRSVSELRALGEISQAVGSTLDLETVLATIVSHAVQLSGSDEGVVYEFDEATHRASRRLGDARPSDRVAPRGPRLGRSGRALRRRHPGHAHAGDGRCDSGAGDPGAPVGMGAEDYLFKPVNPVLLRARIGTSLEKKRLRDQQRELIRKFATAEVAEELLTTGLTLGGKYVEASVMFSDIRSFTRLTEALSPADTIELLNSYYALMFDAIGGHGGIVNQMVGDGLMAIFGAPLPYADHQERAVRAALEMLDPVDGFNREQVARGGVEIRIGIGIAAGPVIAGFTGTQQRVTYTCVGDTVNLAAHLEEHTKVVGQPILIDQNVRSALSDGIRVDAHGVAQFKTRSQAVQVYSVPPGQRP